MGEKTFVTRSAALLVSYRFKPWNISQEIHLHVTHPSSKTIASRCLYFVALVYLRLSAILVKAVPPLTLDSYRNRLKVTSKTLVSHTDLRKLAQIYIYIYKIRDIDVMNCFRDQLFNYRLNLVSVNFRTQSWYVNDLNCEERLLSNKHFLWWQKKTASFDCRPRCRIWSPSDGQIFQGDRMCLFRTGKLGFGRQIRRGNGNTKRVNERLWGFGDPSEGADGFSVGRERRFPEPCGAANTNPGMLVWPGEGHGGATPIAKTTYLPLSDNAVKITARIQQRGTG